jgi:hypothetical protein
MLCASRPCFTTAGISVPSAPRASKPQSHLTNSSVAPTFSGIPSDLLCQTGYHGLKINPGRTLERILALMPDAFIVSFDEQAEQWLAEHPSDDALVIAYRDTRC